MLSADDRIFLLAVAANDFGSGVGPAWEANRLLRDEVLQIGQGIAPPAAPDTTADTGTPHDTTPAAEN